MRSPHIINFRVYYEDTDSGGVVYYANYLKFAERARTEMLREKNISQSTLAQDEGILFVVRRASLDLLAPARLDDMLEITTHIKELGGASLKMLQQICCQGKNLAEVEVLVVCVNDKFKAARIPDAIRAVLTNPLI
jgi:acyl-CoA thioester hydrolase